MEANLVNIIKESGRDAGQVEQQLEYFKQGFPYLAVDRAAAINDGILKLDADQIEAKIQIYETKQSDLEIVKFVPASGAASRMFKQLFEFLEASTGSEASDFIQKFIEGLGHFAFRDHLDLELQKQGSTLQQEDDQRNYRVIIKALLTGMSYGQLPKGLLHFHEYDGFVRTPVQEHFAEGVAYAKGAGSTVRLHFTVSPEHQQFFEDHTAESSKDFSGVDFHIEFSQQKKSTDTIAVTPDNKPFYEEDGSLLFRPAGHGALLENLNDIDADLIFIKNIDNVVPDYLKSETIRYKKVIAGVLLEAQQKAFQALISLDDTDSDLASAEEVSAELFIDLGTNYPALSRQEKVDVLRNVLDRPIRVCGMVKNTGEPGGGPFWAKDEDGKLSLQIAETAQLDPNDNDIMLKLRNSTHFNPTDLVCGVRNYRGGKFNLLNYRDPRTGFISEKSKSGRQLKALELPGLWNGAMSNWITLFCEVPLITFNPVKTINDLLRAEHQPA
ncbi:MAG: DUF4301 family protein [Bacteroidota bacterium]